MHLNTNNRLELIPQMSKKTPIIFSKLLNQQ